jgi:hypothetical protein
MLPTENQEQWLALCEQASKEQDSKKLSILVAEILRLTSEKHNGIDQLASEGNPKLT